MSVLRTKTILWIVFAGSLLLLVSVISAFPISPAHAATQTIAPTNPNIKYVGRWDTSSSAMYTSYWPGAYFVTQFTGTPLSMHTKR